MEIEYNGSPYCGWQSQPDGRTVQDFVQRSLSKVASHPVQVQCAGRTDAGVHATAQIAHFDTESSRSERQWVLGVNTNLPKSINVSWVRPVSDDFHARFSALVRRYRYVILNRQHRSALLHERVHFEPRMLNSANMHSAARCLIGEHDFTAFRAAGCQAKSPVRTIHSVLVSQHGDFITIDIEANAFLQNMVRIIVGTLLRIGRGDEQVCWLNDVLVACDRKHLGATAPAEGLYLTAVKYADAHGLPYRAQEPGIFPFIGDPAL
ncbi:MAG: tRNA pseudouridine(38-40) synthase TruA [Gammaproteobacteria bacterium]